MRRSVWIFVCIALAFLFAVYIWPTEYYTTTLRGRVVRVHRFTGEMQVATGDGWR